jgi:hypothetical protein
MFGGKEAKEPAAPSAKKQAAAEAAPPPVRLKDNDPLAIQAREERALWRRLDVCLDLREIADKKNDDALRERVDQLEQKAWEVYHQRTGTVGARTADAAALTRPAQPAADAGRTAARDTTPWNQGGEQP